MAGGNRRKGEAGADRYLERRTDGGYRYQRWVPIRFRDVDSRRVIKTSLHTADLAIARARRDAQEEADDRFWESLIAGEPRDAARARHAAASARATALGFRYAAAAEIAATEPIEALVARIRRLAELGGAAAPDLDYAALLGATPAPTVTVSEAFEIYFNEIESGQRVSKSPKQYRTWRKVKERARNNFVAVVGDLPIDKIGRADAQAFHKHWRERVEAEEVTANSAARDFGNLRLLFREYMKWIDKPDAANPFRNMSFSGDVANSRPPFPTKWIRDKFLKGTALAGLNSEARGVFLAAIETGCRPSELANLRPENIRVDAAVPHIRIAPARGIEIKTKSSIREIPLVGVAVAVFEAHPGGFPRYFDKPDALSQALMKYLKAHKLLPSGRHGVYSLRHSFKKRCTEAGLDYGLVCTLMGHATGQPVYGDGGSLEWRRRELEKIALTFDKAVV